MYSIKRDFLRAGHRLRPGGNYVKTSITVHSTGNANSTALNERKWLDNPSNNRNAAWHYCVGDGVVVQALPEVEESWHCGKDVGNKYSISVEIIESGDRLKVLMTAAEFVADLMRKYGFGMDRLKRHRDWTTKVCPGILIDKALIKNNLDWAWFVATVRAILEGEEMVEKIKVIVDGKEVEAERVLKDGYNYIKLRDLCGLMGYNVSSKGSIPILTKKV